jgi:hypothetical protein
MRRVAKLKRGVPPFGHKTQLRVFIDPDLLQDDEVCAGSSSVDDRQGRGNREVDCCSSFTSSWLTKDHVMNCCVDRCHHHASDQ